MAIYDFPPGTLPASQAVAKVDRECSPKVIIAISEQVRLSKSQKVR
jgi:hypothetical protein